VELAVELTVELPVAVTKKTRLWYPVEVCSNSSRTELFANFSGKTQVRQVQTFFLSSQTVRDIVYLVKKKNHLQVKWIPGGSLLLFCRKKLVKTFL
jgi:hypothetical protein